MISLDKTLLGSGTLGDAQYRHKMYGEHIGKISIIVFTRPGLGKKDISPQVSVYPTNSRSRLFFIMDAYRIGKSIAEQEPASLIDTQDPFFTGFAGYLLKRALRVPLEVHFHGDFWTNPFSLSTPLENKYFMWFARFVSKRADGIRVVSSGIKERIQEMGIPKECIRVIPTPVNLARFQRIDGTAVFNIKKQYAGRGLVLFVGRLEAVKNLSMLLRAAEIVRMEHEDVLFLCIGEGRLKHWFQEQIKKKHLTGTVCAIGGVDSEKLPPYYAAADVFVLTSWSESFGKVLLEAGAAGVPVVSTATTGARDIIKDCKTGFLVPVNDEHTCAKRIIQLLNDERLRKEMGDAARISVAQHFGQEKTIASIIQFWRDLAQTSYK